LNKALENSLAKIYVVFAIFCKLKFHVRVQLGQTIGTVYGGPFGGKTKSFCKSGETVANLNASESPRH
jgi:hypothetical protein